MDTHSHTAPSKPSARTAQGPVPQPTSGRENSKLMYFFIGAAVLALLLVLSFNALGPEGASRTGIGDGPAQSPAGPTTGGPSPATGTDGDAAGAQNSGAARPGAGGATTITTPAPQAADTPTPPGRESVGAPVGGSPSAGPGAAQGVSGDGTTAGDTPAAAAQSGASAIPAAPPASN
jgi:hypothetical protein